MTPTERDQLNAEYAVVCKGVKASSDLQKKMWKHEWQDANGDSFAEIPDFLSDEADAHRRMASLILRHCFEVSQQEGSTVNLYFYGVRMFRGADLKEATMRACIALKVMVM